MNHCCLLAGLHWAIYAGKTIWWQGGPFHQASRDMNNSIDGSVWAQDPAAVFCLRLRRQPFTADAERTANPRG